MELDGIVSKYSIIVIPSNLISIIRIRSKYTILTNMNTSSSNSNNFNNSCLIWCFHFYHINRKFLVWNEFQFCLTARQAEWKKVMSLVSAHVCVIGTNSEPKNRTIKLEVSFLMHVQNITFNFNMLFLDHNRC